MRVTVIQTKPEFLKANHNRKQLVKALSSVKSDLIVFPELCTSGYNFRSKKDVRECSENGKNGPTATLLQSMAKKKNCAIVAGIPEFSKGYLYNAALFVTPKNRDIYRKNHLFFNEKKYFQPGNNPFPVYKWKGMRIGLLICFDWFFPEASRSLALKGADLIAHPSNLVMPYAPAGMKTRSLENHVFSMTANRVGKERNLSYIGQSQILGVRGDVLGKLGAKKVGALTVRIDPRSARRKFITNKNHIFKDRRVSLYK